MKLSCSASTVIQFVQWSVYFLVYTLKEVRHFSPPYNATQCMLKSCEFHEHYNIVCVCERENLLRRAQPPLSHFCLQISEHLTAPVNLVSLPSSASHMESWSDFWITASNIWSGSNWQLWYWAWLLPLPRIPLFFSRSNYNFTGWN